MKYLALIPTLLLAGCFGTVPISPKFPEVPDQLKEKCPELKVITHDDNVSIVEVTKSVTENYTTYHECSVKVENWIEWYNDQKKIYEKVTK